MPQVSRILNRVGGNLRFMAVLALVLVALFGRSIWKGFVLALGDVPDQFLPWRTFVAERISQGEIPLWNRFSFCGAPFLANLQSAVLYPIDRLADLVFDPPRALMAGVVLHLFLGGLFLYALARKWGACHTGAGIAALGYALGGFHAIHLWGGNLLTVTSSVYLPAHLLVVHLLSERIEAGKTIASVAVGGALLAALQVTSGHAQMTFYNVLFVAIYAASLLVRMNGGRSRFFLAVMCVGVTGALLAAPQILPTLEYTRYSSRQGTLPFDPATEFSFGWEFLLSFFLPEYLGTRADLNTALGKDTYWGDWKNWSGVYLGMLPAFGWVYLAMTKAGRARLRVLLGLGGILAFIALVLALGRNTPVYWFIHHTVPPFGKFRAPSKFLPGLVVPLAAIGAVGVSVLMDDLRRRGEGSGRDRLKKNSFLVLAIGVVSLFVHFILVAEDRSDATTHIVAREVFRSVGFLGVGLGLFGWICATSKSTLAATWVLILIAATDMGLYLKKYLPMAPPEAISGFPSRLVEKHRPGAARVLLTPEVPHANACLPLEIPTAGGYDPFQVRYYVEEFERNGYLDPNTVHDAWSPSPAKAAELGASFVLSSRLLNLPGLQPLEKHPPWFLYRVEDPAPFIEFIPGATASSATGTASLSWEWDGDRLLVEGEVPSSGRLLIRQTYVPGWKGAPREGPAIPIERSAPFWQKLPVAEGPLNLILIYDPWGWKYGLRLFPLGVLGLLGLAVLGRRKRTDA